MRRGVSLVTVIWIVVGLVVALTHDYPITNISSFLSFLLAVLLWPLVLLDVDLHLHLSLGA